jgi:hypothetical protein
MRDEIDRLRKWDYARLSGPQTAGITYCAGSSLSSAIRGPPIGRVLLPDQSTFRRRQKLAFLIGA